MQSRSIRMVGALVVMCTVGACGKSDRAADTTSTSTSTSTTTTTSGGDISTTNTMGSMPVDSTAMTTKTTVAPTVTDSTKTTKTTKVTKKP